MEVNKYNKEVQQKIARLLDIPNDIVFDLPKITIIGNIQLYIENHRGIIEYTPESVRLSVSFGELEISGEMLTIRNITREEIHLDGLIRSVQCKS